MFPAFARKRIPAIRQLGPETLVCRTGFWRTVWPTNFGFGTPGAGSHVLIRGVRREPIFSHDTDRQGFLETLGQACGKADWQVHAFCLMSNHFHLMVETRQANLLQGLVVD